MSLARSRSVKKPRPYGTGLSFLLLTVCAIGSGANLTEAVKAGDRQAVRNLIRQHANVNVADPDGSTALHFAAQAEDLEMVQILLKAGALAKVSNRNGVTPLWLAATSGNAGIARELLNAGADANSNLPGGETVLMTAAESGNAELVELLLVHGANVGALENNYGSTALMFAAEANQAQAAKVLIAHGAEVNGRSRALTVAKDRFGLEGVVSILPHGSWTPLMYAGRQGSVAAIRTLADSGADLNLADPDGTTALLLAIMNGHYDAAALLVEKGADPDKPDSAGMAPLYAATDENTLGEIFGRPSRTSHDELNGVGLMKVLLAHGADPNVKLKGPTLQRAHTPGEPTLGEGATPLMRAAKNGDVAAIKLLLDHGADISLPQKNGTTALMFAAGLGRGVGTFAKDYATDGEMLAAAKLLVDRGADVNAISVAGQTAIHFAAQAADTNLPAPTDDIVLLLASHGARLDVADKQGRRPIDMAAGKGLRGRAGGPVTPRQSTIKLLGQLMDGSVESAAKAR